MNATDYLEWAAEALGPLKDRVVFVGGMIREFLVTDPAVEAPRPTIDVDVIVEIYSKASWDQFEQQIRKLGFKQDLQEDAPVCRYLFRQGERDLLIDFMPADPDVLGFSNRWYPSAYNCAWRLKLHQSEISVIDAVHFVATKLVSFSARGGGDYFHHDLEDVIVVIDGRKSFLKELETANIELRQYIACEIRLLLQKEEFLSYLPGHLGSDRASQDRFPALLEVLKAIAQIAER